MTRKHSTHSPGAILAADGDTGPTIVRWVYDPAEPTLVTIRLLRHGRKVAVASIGRDTFAEVLAGVSAPEFWRLDDVLVLLTQHGMVVTTAGAAVDLLVEVEAEEGVDEIVARMAEGAL